MDDVFIVFSSSSSSNTIRIGGLRSETETEDADGGGGDNESFWHTSNDIIDDRSEYEEGEEDEDTVGIAEEVILRFAVVTVLPEALPQLPVLNDGEDRIPELTLRGEEEEDTLVDVSKEEMGCTFGEEVVEEGSEDLDELRLEEANVLDLRGVVVLVVLVLLLLVVLAVVDVFGVEVNDVDRGGVPPERELRVLRLVNEEDDDEEPVVVVFG